MIRPSVLGAAFALAIAATAPASAQGFFEQLFGGRSYQAQPGGQLVSLRSAENPGSIIVSFGDRKLYYIAGKGRAISYPIAIPKEEAKWAGNTFVSQKRVNPPWTPTAEMRRENPKLPAFVPGGHPRNPLGNVALYLGSSMYRIHGTDAPWLIGAQVSHGCIRMFNSDAADLFRRARVGARVMVTWQRMRTAA